MFSKTFVARFRATAVVLGISPYALFLKNSKGLLKGIPVVQRCKILAAQYKALPAAEKAALVAKAKATKFVKRVKRAPVPRKAGPYAKFVKANYSKVANLPLLKRFAAISKLWKAAKKQ